MNTLRKNDTGGLVNRLTACYRHFVSAWFDNKETRNSLISELWGAYCAQKVCFIEDFSIEAGLQQELLRQSAKLEKAPDSNLEKEILMSWVDKTIREFQNIFLVLELNGFDFEERHISLLPLVYWLAYESIGRLEKVQKAKTALILAQALDQTELPPMETLLPGDNANLLLVGRPGRVIRTRCLGHRQKTRQDVKLALDLYHKKGGALPVDDRFIQANLEKHWNVLTTEPPEVVDVHINHPSGVPHYAISGPLLEDELVQAVRDTVREVFGQKRGRKLNPFPSYGASFLSSRKEGGAFGQIFDQSNARRQYLLGDIDYLCGYLSYKTDVKEIRCPVPYELYEDILLEHEMKISDFAANGENVRCVPVALCEPYKVRVITRGDAHEYQLCRRWQRTISQILRSHPTFRLTGHPISRQDMDEILNQSYGDVEGTWISGDYSSATDLLSPLLSETCLAEICTILKVPAAEERTLLSCLTRHRLVNEQADFMPKCVKGEEPTDENSALQRRGQLMGSPISFPILCLVNAAVTRLALKTSAMLEGRTHPLLLAHTPMMINGDDVLFRSHSDEEYAIWKAYTTAAGLEFSVGKNYSSDRWCVINSEVWEVQKVLDPFAVWKWQLGERVPVLNFRMLHGGSKSQSTEGPRAFTAAESFSAVSFKARAELWLSAVPDHLKDHAMKLFINQHKAVLTERVPRGVSWWIAPQLGGLGLPATRSLEGLISPQQLKLAAYLQTRPHPAHETTLSPLGSGTLLPGWVEAARGTINSAVRDLGVVYNWDTTRPVDVSLGALRAFSGLGTGEMGDQDSLRSWTRKYQSLWRRAQQTSLRPMAWQKATIVENRFAVPDSPVVYH